jgi:hypothetical protein
MPTIQIGNFVEQYQPDGDDVKQGPDGSGEATLTFKRSSDSFTLASLPNPLSQHPKYPALRLYEAQAKREPGNIMVVTCTYRGVIVGNKFTFSQQEFTVNTSSEPIETHPRFSSPVAAPPVSPTEIATIQKFMDNNNVPVYAIDVFGSTKEGVLLYNKKRRGTDSYLSVGGTYKLTYIQADVPSEYNSIGKITIAPPLAPIPPGKRNYLYTGLSWRKQGGVVTVNEEYTMSGFNGFDEDLYDFNV